MIVDNQGYPYIKKFEWCNLVRFGGYFHNFFTFINLYKNNDKL